MTLLNYKPIALCCLGLIALPLDAQTRPRPVTLVAVGDILLADSVGRMIRKKGADFPFARMKSTLQNADITFGNLECCVSKRGAPIEKRFTFRADPGLVGVLKRSGFTIVSLANNHTWDYGRNALEDTVQSVRESGIKTVGAGRNRTEAHRLVIIEKNGMKIGFLAYLGLIPALISESETEPTLSMASEKAITAEVSSARKQVDFLLVSLHAGQEMAQRSTPRQRGFAHAAIDAGADMVIGHHPHVMQLPETYHGKQIFYSLGNFVFSAEGRGSGSLLKATLYPGGKLIARQTKLDLSGGQPHFSSSLSSLLSSKPIRGRHRKERVAKRTRKPVGRTPQE